MDNKAVGDITLQRHTSRRTLGIRELPESERPRERLVAHGATRLSTIELLAIIIGSGSSGQSALSLAHHVLSLMDGSLRRIASEPIAALTDVSGIGLSRATVVHAALELGRRMLQETRREGVLIRIPHDMYRVFGPRLEDLPVEEFHVAVLDSQQRLQRDILISRGILNSSLVHPREVFREAIAERACSLILIHNHPSGDPTPSTEDRLVTEQLISAGQLIGIPVRDHVIIGRGRYVSFLESGWMRGDGGH